MSERPSKVTAALEWQKFRRERIAEIIGRPFEEVIRRALQATPTVGSGGEE